MNPGFSVISNLVVTAAYCMLMIIHSVRQTSADDSAPIRERQFFEPPSFCLTGSSCKNCIETKMFFTQQVCCYHCRLDNLVIQNGMCHCLDLKLPSLRTDISGNCSSGKVCDNCAVRISSDMSEDPYVTSSATNFCCQDCGIVMPYLLKDQGECHCARHLEGREHQIAPRYDPAQDATSVTDKLHSLGPAPKPGQMHIFVYVGTIVAAVYLY